MSRYRHALGTALLVVAVLAVGGCGGDTGPTATRTSPVPADEKETEPSTPTDDATDDSADDSDAAPEDDLGGRGIASPLTWWDARHPRVSWSKECAAQTGMPSGDPVAYRLAKDEVVCATVPSAASLKNHLISVDVVFASPVDEDRARKAALALLPSDASPTEPTEGTNPDWSYLGGGCLNNNFRTATMKNLTERLGKDAEPWASALYYSDGATEDGAVGDYTGKVKQIALSTDANEPGESGELTC
jgi:hypothetical protein